MSFLFFERRNTSFSRSTILYTIRKIFSKAFLVFLKSHKFLGHQSPLMNVYGIMRQNCDNSFSFTQIIRGQEFRRLEGPKRRCILAKWYEKFLTKTLCYPLCTSQKNRDSIFAVSWSSQCQLPMFFNFCVSLFFHEVPKTQLQPRFVLRKLR